MQTQRFTPQLETTTLIVLEQGEIQSFNLGTQRRWTIGRKTEENIPDIPLKSEIAGRTHGIFSFVENQLYYADKGSRNGTFHNGEKIARGLGGRMSPVALANGDILQIDYSDLNRPDPRGVWMLVITGDAVKGNWSYLSLAEQDEMIIGRNKQICDLVLPFPYISAQHTKIIAKNDNDYYISNCSSVEGTWLNGEKLLNLEKLKNRDHISICDFHFIFTGKGLLYNSGAILDRTYGYSSQTIMYAHIESKKVLDKGGRGKKELLRDIQIDIKASELIALLGSSGAGKSTLVGCLCGTDRDGVTGSVKLHGEDFYHNHERLKRLIGIVPQNEVVHKLLPVGEELMNAAILRLPNDFSKKELKEQVKRTIRMLNLEGKEKTQIGKLSGGEQKRVNIGVELVADREILFLDEPDAGLDPPFKRELFTMLQSLAHKNGKSILAIIHDVSDIDLFDRVIMLAKVDGVGRLAYVGTPKGAEEYFSVERLSDAYKVIEKEPEKYITVNDYGE